MEHDALTTFAALRNILIGVTLLLMILILRRQRRAYQRSLKKFKELQDKLNELRDHDV